jgi:hypothetical protein
MAVITSQNLSAPGLSHTPEVDLLESGDERERVPWREVRPPTWAVALLVVLALGVTGGGLVVLAEERSVAAREAARLEVDVRPAGTSSSTVRGVSRGELSLLLVNRREGRVRLGELRIAVEGLRVTSVEPAFGQPLGPYEERLFTIGFLVPDCSRLVLPGRLLVSLAADGQAVERRELAVVDPDLRSPGRAGFTLGGCPPSARGSSAGTSTDVGVRPAGGSSERDGVGAQGVLRLEVRNAGPPLQLVSITGEVPGVSFTAREIDGGRSIETDGLVIVRLAFRIEDCGALQPAGRLVLVVERFGALQELGLRAVAEPEAGVGPQVDLAVLFDACA